MAKHDTLTRTAPDTDVALYMTLPRLAYCLKCRQLFYETVRLCTSGHPFETCNANILSRANVIDAQRTSPLTISYLSRRRARRFSGWVHCLRAAGDDLAAASALMRRARDARLAEQKVRLQQKRLEYQLASRSDVSALITREARRLERGMRCDLEVARAHRNAAEHVFVVQFPEGVFQPTDLT